MNAQLARRRRGYLVCCVERTGSGLLTGGLTQSGVAGLPREYFNPVSRNEPWLREILGESTALSGIEKILAAGTTSNGVFGAKLHWSHFRHLTVLLTGEGDAPRRLAPGTLLQMLERIPDGLPTPELVELLRKQGIDRANFSATNAWFQANIPDLRFVWLRRRNMVARAISHYRALSSGIWHQAKAGSGTPGAGPAPAPAYDFSKIHKLHGLGLLQQENWRWFFEHHSITPLHIDYESLVAQYADTLRSVADFLGVDYPADRLAAPASARQADSLSSAWEERYVETSARL